MNSQRRHDLEENWLASFLAKINHSIDPYSKPIAVGVAAAFIGLIGWGFYSSTQADNRSDATLQLIDASISGDTETLATVASQYPTTSAGAWSRLYQGGQKMGVGIGALFTSREEAEELLDEAGVAYRLALGMSDDKVLQSRAHFGLARIAESLGNVDEAIESYEAAMAVGESNAMINEAKGRIELLTQPNTKEFLAWFQEQDFSPADPSLPPSLPGAGQLPGLPDLDLPDLDLPDLGEPMSDETKSDQPESSEPEMKEEAASAETDATTATVEPAKEEAKPEPKKPEPAVKEPAPKEEPAAPEPKADTGKAETKKSEPAKPAEPETELNPAQSETPAPDSPAEEASTNGGDDS